MTCMTKGLGLSLAATGALVALDSAAQSLATAASATVATAASGAASAVAGTDSALMVVELAKALAWPVVALAIAAGLKRPISDFVRAIGGRINKLSVFNVEVELSAAKEAPAKPLLDEIRTATNAALISDSTQQMLQHAQLTEPADFAVVELGSADQWLTSRLFITTVMMERMRGVKVIVFLERGDSTERRFVAVANARQLRWGLARQFPWLEAALIKAESGLYSLDPPKMVTVSKTVSDNGAFEPQLARQLVSTFLQSLQLPTPVAPPSAPLPGWVQLSGYQEKATWVSRSSLSSVLPASAFEACAKAFADQPRARRSRALLRCRAPYVALVDDDKQYVGMVDRSAYLEGLAASMGEEPETGTVASA